MPALAGLLTGAGLIIAIGPQNIFLLQQGVRRSHTAAVVAVCAVSDVVLIVAGVAGLGALVAAHPGVVTFAKLAGGAYIVVLGLMAAKRCLRSDAAIIANADEAATMSRWAAVATALALTWLNPHVYLDTVLTMGAIATSHGNGKWAFAIGACAASVLWFTSLGHGAGRLSKVFSSPRAWKILDGGVAVVMVGMGAALLLSA
ncbi:Lysine exporter protein (LYSE/YGGA) [Gordonia bronchialis DSM 43247]|jgi:L-lysine exporter family protein LysE/ArgO|uniref:Lysine exporter protein (LYSE/YGGA) n=1 Tax=Gordonia bronchialis (strain ATCC 25592 / DSM 43247 / BCRC 13721 / JCM 3198 / KCTC 3076 / NBRC 16047 / NCTC 10667) TaxID=526226 RepID=D0L6V2_GORB4|nr:Lysine exporter protein (LYSE/YGGA) [Gordonia bronchialis DSM 43247]STQ66672.1 Arginine exporter protein ArgO [Gordonia bronchialis]